MKKIISELFQNLANLSNLEEIELNEKSLGAITEKLKETIFGQDKAMEEIARIFLRTEAGMNDPQQPLGVVLLYGPTGVGKTETARAIYEYWFADKPNLDRLIILNMSEYAASHTITKIVGSPPSYVGYNEESVLPHRIINTGRTIVVLDEFEKAHPEIKQAFLGAFSEGKMSARDKSKGAQNLYFDHTLFILTSNAGSFELAEARERKKLGFGSQNMPQPNLHDVAKKALSRHFSPELLGRVSMVMYEPLTHESHLRIVDKFTDAINMRNMNANAPLVHLTDEAKNLLCQRAGLTKDGGRGIKAQFKVDVVTPLADLFVQGKIDQNHGLIIDANGNKYVFRKMPVDIKPKAPEPETQPTKKPSSKLAHTNNSERPRLGNTKEANVLKRLHLYEQREWTKMLGVEITAPPVPNYVTPEIKKNLKKFGMELRYIPKLDLGTPNELKHKDLVSFLDEIERRLPNWHRYETLTLEEKNNHNVTRNLKALFWKLVKENEVGFPKLEGTWVAIETIKKPRFGERYDITLVSEILGLSDRFNVSWNNVHSAIEANKQELLGKIGLPLTTDVRMLEAIEWNLLANREDWGATNTSEWTNTESSGSDFGTLRIRIGDSDDGGAAKVARHYPAYSGKSTGFRLAFILRT